MDAMIFAAGLGTRLRPLTDSCPKALIEVGGMTMLQRAIRHVRHAGAERVVVNVHHHAGMVKEWIAANEPEVIVSDESARLLDTGGGLAAAAPLFKRGADILVMNADIFTDLELRLLVAAHRGDCTLLTSRRDSSRRLLFDGDGRMQGWLNMGTGEIRPKELNDVAALVPLAFGGIHVISPRALAELRKYAAETPDGKFSITDFYINRCSGLNIMSYTPAVPFTWIDIGRPSTLAQAQSIAH